MEITIGRDKATQKLCITVDQKPYLAGVTVPMSVSRQHCKIIIRQDNTMVLKNLNLNNVTYVNNSQVVTKTITRNDQIALGVDRYILDWTTIDAALPKVVDIRPLRKVWETYYNETKAINKSTQRFQNIRNGTTLITMSAIGIGYFSGGTNIISQVLYAVAIALTVLFWLKTMRDIDKNDEKKEKIKEKFQQDYCCPCDGYFFGYTDYSILEKNIDCCPRCRTKLKK